MAKLIFKDAEEAKKAIMDSQKQEIEAFYKSWSDDILKKANKYAMSSAPSSVVSEMQMKQLMKQMEATGKQISNEIYKKITENMYVVSDETIKCNSKWLAQFGFSEDGINAAFSNVPDQIVRRLVTGQIYDSGWSLSKRIWSANEETMKSAYQIVAKGVAENSPIQNIAKELSNLVNPNVAKSWNPIIAMKNTQTGEIEYKRIYRREVDYNAQRLARTLVQHSYQQSFVAVTKDNPFVEDYIWHSNGSRACELCMSRDGKHFKKDELPMDHPNGMCVIEPAVAEDMTDQLADWFNSPDGTYPEIDKFASNFGYEAKQIETASTNTHKVVNGKNIVDSWQRRSNEFTFEIEDVMDAQGFDGLPKVVDASEFDEYVKQSNFVAQRAYSAPSQEILNEYRNQLYGGKWYVDCSTGGSQYGRGMYCAADYTGNLTDGIVSEMNYYKSIYREQGIEYSYVETLTLDKSAKIIKFNDVFSEYRNNMRGNLEEIAKRNNLPKTWIKRMQSAYDLADELKTLKDKGYDTSSKTYDNVLKKVKNSENSAASIAEKAGMKFVDATRISDAYWNEVRNDAGSMAAKMGYDAINAEGHGDSGSYTVILNRTKLILRNGG